MQMLGGMLVAQIVMMSVPGYFVAQPAALMYWDGGWRKAAMAPFLITVPALLWSLFALSQGSNLWPLALIFAAALGSLYLSALWVARSLF